MLNKDELFNEIKDIIVQFMDPEDEISLATLNEKKSEAIFTDDLGIDSIDVVEIVNEIEIKLNVQFKNEEIEKMVKIEDSILAILSKLRTS